MALINKSKLHAKKKFMFDFKNCVIIIIKKPGPRLCIVFRNMVIFYGEELLAPRPTSKLEDLVLL
jgi:hypothetical protein